MTRIAAIDIGTNSTKMTVADADGLGSLSIVSEASEITRLGKGVDETRRLRDDSMAQTLDAIKRFADDARSQNVEEVLCAGTSALRDAANGPEFLERAERAAGIKIEIITGLREAHLAYAAVRFDPSLELPPEIPILVFDIGGGSTELILGRGQEVVRSTSLDMGAVRLTERFFKNDPPGAYETAQAARFAEQSFATFPRSDAIPAIVGIGGTAVNIAAVVQMEAGRPQPAVHAATVTHADVSGALDRFKRVPLEERRAIPGLEPARADVIVAGALILDSLLTYFHAAQFTVSIRGLRYGLISDWAKNRS